MTMFSIPVFFELRRTKLAKKTRVAFERKCSAFAFTLNFTDDDNQDRQKS